MKHKKLLLVAGALFILAVLFSVVSLTPLYGLVGKTTDGKISEQALDAQLDRSELMAQISFVAIGLAAAIAIIWVVMTVRSVPKKAHAPKDEE
jgi:hypothetical protein